MRVLPLVAIAACVPAEPAERLVVVLPDAAESAAIESTSTVTDPPVEPTGFLIDATFEAPAPAGELVGNDLIGLRTSVKRWFLALSARERHIVRATCRLRRDSPCWQMMDLRVRGPNEQALDDSHRFRPFGDSAAMDEFCTRTTGDGFCSTPLVVAFDDEPVAYVPPTHRFTFRDTPLLTDWPTAKTPWIALDRDGDGAITSGFELFGDATAHDGFAALAALDANADGAIDRHDPDFAKLLLWSDTNADRRSTPDELTPLASAVVAIPLAHRMDPRCVNGNCEGERGTAQLAGGRTGTVIDIYLAER